MNCGKSSTFDKIGCAAEVAGGEMLEFLECLTGIDMACIEAVAGEIADCINGECVIKIGGDCLSFEQEFSWDKELFENKANFDVNLSGNMKLNVGMELTLDLKEWQFTFDIVSTVTKSLEIDAESQAEYAYSEEKDLAPKKTVFRKVRKQCSYLLSKYCPVMIIHTNLQLCPAVLHASPLFLLILL